MRNVTINYPALVSLIKGKGLKIGNFLRSIGKSANFLSQKKNSCSYTTAIAMAYSLGVPVESIIVKEPEPEEDAQLEHESVDSLGNDRLDRIERKLDTLIEMIKRWES